MDAIISGIFAAIILIWIAVKFIESAAKSTAKSARKRAEATQDELYVKRVRAANEMSAQDLKEFEEWKRQKKERHP